MQKNYHLQKIWINNQQINSKLEIKVQRSKNFGYHNINLSERNQSDDAWEIVIYPCMSFKTAVDSLADSWVGLCGGLTMICASLNRGLTEQWTLLPSVSHRPESVCSCVPHSNWATENWAWVLTTVSLRSDLTLSETKPTNSIIAQWTNKVTFHNTGKLTLDLF